jgi:hypothetical protein
VLEEICFDLIAWQRKRQTVINSRIRVENRLIAIVAVEDFGYNSITTPKNQRKPLFEKARLHIQKVIKGEAESSIKEIIDASWQGVHAFKVLEIIYKKNIEKLVRQLPVISWLKDRDQLGIKEMLVGAVIGEAGNLLNYPNPAKLWKRMACTPHEYEGHVHMGQAWASDKLRKKNGVPVSLPKEEWIKFGYNKQRRKISYQIGHNIVLQNKEGPYRTRFKEVRALCNTIHSDWPDIRKMKHSALLATKLFLKNLWIEWRNMEIT